MGNITNEPLFELADQNIVSWIRLHNEVSSPSIDSISDSPWLSRTVSPVSSPSLGQTIQSSVAKPSCQTRRYPPKSDYFRRRIQKNFSRELCWVSRNTVQLLDQSLLFLSSPETLSHWQYYPHSQLFSQFLLSIFQRRKHCSSGGSWRGNPWKSRQLCQLTPPLLVFFQQVLERDLFSKCLSLLTELPCQVSVDSGRFRDFETINVENRNMAGGKSWKVYDWEFNELYPLDFNFLNSSIPMR